MGTREAPLPYDESIDLTWIGVGEADGSVWTTTIGPPRDITDEVLATNEFNDPPPDDHQPVDLQGDRTIEGSRFPGFARAGPAQLR